MATIWVKEFSDGGFEDTEAEYLESLVVRAFFEDGHQGINANGGPELGAHGIGTGAIEHLDAQMLFEPAEEQLDLPALLIQFCAT